MNPLTKPLGFWARLKASWAARKAHNKMVKAAVKVLDDRMDSHLAVIKGTSWSGPTSVLRHETAASMVCPYMARYALRGFPEEVREIALNHTWARRQNLNQMYYVHQYHH